MKKNLGLHGLFCMLVLCISIVANAQQKSKPKFNVLAFYTGINDMAHVSYVKEANLYFDSISKVEHFKYESTNNWNRMTLNELVKYDVILFLDTRPEKEEQRIAFQKYMEKGGGWMGFHFAAFALNKSAYDSNWDWYHNTFLGSGEYKSNTWKPTSAILKRESKTKYSKIPEINASPNEWYAWKNDLSKNKDIEILYAVDERSFPLGTGPKEHEIWKDGYYPIIWKNKKYNMIYSNMGHNDMDYDHKYDAEKVNTLSWTFSSPQYSSFIVNALQELAKEKKKKF